MRLAFLTVFLFLCGLLQAQYHQSLYPELEGEELMEAIQDYFTPSNTPSSDFARDVLYSDIYNVNGFVSCVYTGFTINLTSGDPSMVAFDAGINAEHTMPRSFLEGSNGEYDLHNLYPTRIEVNSDRSTFPFSEIADNQTDTWYYLDSEQSNIPSSNIDLYSELVPGFFEPREDHKGNVARTMMYTYAIYGDVIESNAPQYFEQQRQQLCQWHIDDPVDQAEYERSYAISSYQNAIPNPFVIDCTLAQRTFCQDTNIDCALPPVSDIDSELFENKIALFAENPFSGQTTIQYELPQEDYVQLSVYDAQGRLVQVLIDEYQAVGKHAVDFQTEQSNILYIVVLQTSDILSHIKLINN